MMNLLQFRPSGHSRGMTGVQKIVQAGLSFYRWTNGGPRSSSNCVAELAQSWGLLTFCYDHTFSHALVGYSARKQRPWMRNTADALAQTAMRALTFSCFLGTRFSQDIHSMGTPYSKLCLWFDEVKPNLTLVFMFANILLPSKRHVFFMQLTNGLMFLTLEVQ